MLGVYTKKDVDKIMADYKRQIARLAHENARMHDNVQYLLTMLYNKATSGGYELVEEYDNCHVQILADRATGCQSIGWWQDDDRPVTVKAEGEADDAEKGAADETGDYSHSVSGVAVGQDIMDK